ncbi:hypothetical protein PsAD2_02556 [Pseudovibrio axinellae]|uniref:Uncharacterized protein n=1 Tax=Pseudovibrio axinellae TaxID=989403 RepID=A0A165YAI3_9HYPH|nr:hypothetical protein [Pseudovibrio axinellae]KZL18615.1 hypothetical protein PsAD2_02556 [Pseudovibrio axinellae]SER74392.1 hypothetical protein SAMN05421798_11932 [Pseudovibrio axinellae]
MFVLAGGRFRSDLHIGPFVADPDGTFSDFFIPAKIRATVENEYERYGIVTKDPDAPGKACWNIGLYTAIIHPALLPFYKDLYSSEDIEGKIEYVPMRDACKAQTGFGDDEPARPPRINPKDDWWNYVPSEYGDIA